MPYFGGRMTNHTVEEKDRKTSECLRCGFIFKVAKYIPLKMAWCPQCRSSRIRLYKENAKERTLGK
jgi:predicted Zn-ribbon and HTH transcriptional regulator